MAKCGTLTEIQNGKEMPNYLAISLSGYKSNVSFFALKLSGEGTMVLFLQSTLRLVDCLLWPALPGGPLSKDQIPNRSEIIMGIRAISSSGLLSTSSSIHSMFISRSPRT